MAKKSLILIVTFFLAQTLNSTEIYGIPKIIDGDTVHINNKKIRLEGIDAPEVKQKCTINKKEYLCGVNAKNELKKKLRKKVIKCYSHNKDKYKRYLATCFVGETNINKWMVKNGYALAYRRYSKIYIKDEEFAKKNNLGLWEGSFINPEKWRKLN